MIVKVFIEGMYKWKCLACGNTWLPHKDEVKKIRCPNLGCRKLGTFGGKRGPYKKSLSVAFYLDYRESEGKEKCSGCRHFFERRIDAFGTCEVVRLDSEDSIDPGYVCDFWNKDGENFPLLK